MKIKPKTDDAFRKLKNVGKFDIFDKLNDLLNNNRKNNLNDIWKLLKKHINPNILKKLINIYNNTKDNRLRDALNRWKNIVKTTDKIDDNLRNIIDRMNDKLKLLVPVYFIRWRKINRKAQQDDNAKKLQDFFRKIKIINQKKKDDEKNNNIKNGLDKLKDLKPDISDAFKKLKFLIKMNIFDKLNDILNNNKDSNLKEPYDKIKKYALIKLLKKLIDDLNNQNKKKLDDALKDWDDKAKKLKRLMIILQNLLDNKDDKNKKILNATIKKWIKKINDDKVKKNGDTIVRYIKDKLKNNKARKNWRKLYEKLRKPDNSGIGDIIDKLKKLIKINKVYDILDHNIKNDGWDQFKKGINWLDILRLLKKAVEDADENNKKNKLRIYLTKWVDKNKKLRDRENALIDALDKINDARVGKDTDTLNKVLIIKKILNDINRARTKDFLDKLKDKYNQWLKMIEKLRKIVEDNDKKREQRILDILNKTIKKWKRNGEIDEINKNGKKNS
jgi:hypothetical protein